MADRQKWSIFLDLDNTILDFSKAERIALTQTLTERGVTVTDTGKGISVPVGDVTKGHVRNVNALTTVEEVLAYDYTTGYPEELSF